MTDGVNDGIEELAVIGFAVGAAGIANGPGVEATAGLAV